MNATLGGKRRWRGRAAGRPPLPPCEGTVNLQIIRTRHPPEPHLVMLQSMLVEAGLRLELEGFRNRLARLPKEGRLLIGLDGEHVTGFAHLRGSRDLTAGDTGGGGGVPVG